MLKRTKLEDAQGRLNTEYAQARKIDKQRVQEDNDEPDGSCLSNVHRPF